MTHKRSLILLLLFVFVLAACNLPGGQSEGGESVDSEARIATGVALTLEAEGAEEAPDQAPEDQGADSQEAAPDPPTETPVPPTDTAQPSETPTITLTPTPAVPMVSVSENTNCRVGPGVQYDYIGALNVGEQAQVVGMESTGQYAIIQNPDAGGTCWLWLNYATISGSTSGLPVMTPPATPTPTFTPTPEFDFNGSWEMNIGGFTTTATIVQSGNQITSTFSYLGATVTLDGTVAADGRTVTGTYVTDVPSNGTFAWFMKKNINQFVGNADGADEWCGRRLGASWPSPCLWP